MPPSFPAKLLLFGEYSVLAGSDACAFPLDRFSGRLVMADVKERSSGTLLSSNLSLKQLQAYLTEPSNQFTVANYLDLERLTSDIGSGLAFDSDIPQNYGAGSSGALVAALYHTYRKDGADTDIQTIRTHLAFIESAFHATSSGTDPLVSYLNKPVFIRSGQIFSPDLSLEEIGRHLSIELIDSGKPGVTKAGVAGFQSGSLRDPSPGNLFEEEYIPLINSIVEDIFTGRFPGLFNKILKISEMQLRLFPDLFTPEMPLAARKGIDSGEYAIKLCGSGGGGFYLKFQARQS